MNDYQELEIRNIVDLWKVAYEFQVEITKKQDLLIQEQADLIALLKAQLQAKEEGDVCI